jgi:hypothetical protein
MITVTQQFETEAEARNALNWRNYVTALDHIHMYVRREVKYSDEKPEDKAETIYRIIIDELTDAGWEET